MMIAFLLFSLGGIAIVFAPSMYLLAIGRDVEELAPAAREFLILHNRVWPAALFLFGGIFLYTIVISHRIAGPVHRINGILRKMLEGEYPETVTLRRGDFLHSTAALLEQLSRKLSSPGGNREGGGGAPPKAGGG